MTVNALSTTVFTVNFMKQKIKEIIEKFNSEVNDSEKIIIGVKAHQAETREQLKERLKTIDSYSGNLMQSIAMCYSPAFNFKKKKLKNVCPKCGRAYRYEVCDWGSGDADELSHLREQKRISTVVNKIKKLGYDIQVEHMCGLCFLNEYGQSDKAKGHRIEPNNSVSILSFRFSASDEYTKNIVYLDDCKRLLDFFNGNNAYIGDRDSIRMLSDCTALIKRLLGL